VYPLDTKLDKSINVLISKTSVRNFYKNEEKLAISNLRRNKGWDNPSPC
jgi:hypothetical protein